MNDKIFHEGEVMEVNKGIVKVRIIQRSACAECHAKAACNLSDTKEKIIEIANTYPDLIIGEQVEIEGSVSLGLQAVVYAFVIPLILIFLSLFLLINKLNEGIVAIISMGILIIYYGILYHYRGQLSKKFVFTLKKMER